MEKFADRLRKACEKQPACPDNYGSGSWLRRSLKSEGVDVSGQCISNWQNGRTKPRGVNLSALAKVLDVSEAWLLGYEEKLSSIIKTDAGTFNLPIQLGDQRSIEVCGIPLNLSGEEAQRISKIILALAA